MTEIKKNKNKVKAGYARSEKYHAKNKEELKKNVKKAIKNGKIGVDLSLDNTVSETVEFIYETFKKQFTFFKK